MDDDTLDQIYTGHLSDLPRLSTKVISGSNNVMFYPPTFCPPHIRFANISILQVVRIFTSSTFTDMLMERNTLMEFVYPRIREYCRERYGIEFQVSRQRQ